MYIVYAVKEGIALAENGLSPYSGDIFHEVSEFKRVFVLNKVYVIIVDSTGIVTVQVPVSSRWICSGTVLCGKY